MKKKSIIDEAIIRRIVQEELRNLFPAISSTNPTLPPTEAQSPILDPFIPVVGVPEWFKNYQFEPRIPSGFDQRALRHLKQASHAYLPLPDITHNPFVTEAVNVDDYLAETPWLPFRRDLQTIMPVGAVDTLARCFTRGNRLTPRPRRGRWTVGNLCQGLVGDLLPPLKESTGEELEWTYVPKSLLAPLRASYEAATRPLDGIARPPLPRWFEPVHPYSLVIPDRDDWVFLFGPRSPALGRPILLREKV